MTSSLWVCRPFRRLVAFLVLWHMGAAFLVAQDQPAEGGPPSVRSMDPVGGTGPTDLVRFTSPSSSHYYFNAPAAAGVRLMFLPPELPVLESPIPLRSPLDNGVPPPAELAAYVGDLFYPQLASRLAGDDLSRRARLELESYQRMKHSLLDELESSITAARELQGAARRTVLADGATRQAARLKELEAAAEQIRLELGPPPDGRVESPEQPAGSGPSAGPDPRALRLAAFYTDGLSLSQRRLLLAMAAELRFHGTPASMGRGLFFSPEGAAFRQPVGPSPQTAKSVAAYAEARRVLADSLLAEFERPVHTPAQWRDLAARQAPAFAALENQAEEVRAALQGTDGYDGLPVGPALPPELTARLAAYNSRRQALVLEISSSLSGSVRAAAKPVPAGLAVPVSAFTPGQLAALAALNRERDEIRAALVEYSRTSGAARDRKSIDSLLQDFERSRQALELREEYADYRAAALEPGLSPAQRRLLLDGALQHLALPLPSGEPLPAQ